MSRLVLVARLRDASGSLERLLGLLRRRALPVDTMSVYRAGSGALEVALRFGPLSTPDERVEAELHELVDLLSLRRVGPDAHALPREMALAETDGEIGSWPEDRHGVLRRHPGSTVELTGSPDEIDRALQLMTDRGVLAASARSGEMFPPTHSDAENQTSRGGRSDGPNHR